MEKKLRELASLLDQIATEITFMVNEGKEETVAGIHVELWNYDTVVAGFVELAGRYFFSPDLAKLHGKVVEVKGYQCDYVAKVFDLNGNYICEVEEDDPTEEIREEKEKRKSQLPPLLSRILYYSEADTQQVERDLSPEEKQRRQREYEGLQRVLETLPTLYGKRRDEHKCKNGCEDKTALPSPDPSSRKDDEKKCKRSTPEKTLSFQKALEAFVSPQGLEDNDRSRDILLTYILKPLIQLYLGVLPLPEVLGKLNQFCEKAFSIPCRNFSKNPEKEV